MAFLFWDASGLAKRYTPEAGSGTADALFRLIPASAMLTTAWSYAETFSILLRRRNEGRVKEADFQTAVTALKREIVDHPDVEFLNVDGSAVLAAIPILQRHNLNATDAALLFVLLRFQQSLAPGDALWLVTSDQRFIRAATAEGVDTVNPESVSPEELPEHLSLS